MFGRRQKLWPAVKNRKFIANLQAALKVNRPV